MNFSSKNPDSSRRKQHIGEAFENRAAEFYQSGGFEVIERNWRAGHKEIDLIVRRPDLIVFVEVKAGFSKSFGHPAERVDARKMQNLHRAARRYIAEHGITGCDLRFDVITFDRGEMEHFPNAFQVEPES